MMKMKFIATTTLALAALAGCQERVYSAEEIHEICMDKKRAAQGPTGQASISAGTEGSRIGLSIGVTDDFLLGRDPERVFEQCVQKYNDHNARVATHKAS